MRQLERDQPVGSSLDAVVHPDDARLNRVPLRLAPVPQPVPARFAAAARAATDRDDLWELAEMLGFTTPEPAPARRAATERDREVTPPTARARFAWDEAPARLLAHEHDETDEPTIARRALPAMAATMVRADDSDTELAGLRAELALKERQLSDLEAAAVTAWDDTVPRLEQRIASLIEANRRLKERLNQVPDLALEPGLAVNVAG